MQVKPSTAGWDFRRVPTILLRFARQPQRWRAVVILSEWSFLRARVTLLYLFGSSAGFDLFIPK